MSRGQHSSGDRSRSPFPRRLPSSDHVVRRHRGPRGWSGTGAEIGARRPLQRYTRYSGLRSRSFSNVADTARSVAPVLSLPKLKCAARVRQTRRRTRRLHRDEACTLRRKGRPRVIRDGASPTPFCVSDPAGFDMLTTPAVRLSPPRLFFTRTRVSPWAQKSMRPVDGGAAARGRKRRDALGPAQRRR